jgi:HSP20 family protein
MAEKKPRGEKEREEGAESRSLAPWHPFGELQPWRSLFEEGLFSSRFSRLLDEFFREWPRPRPAAGAFLPAMDVSDDDRQYTITVELPGSRKEDVQVDLTEGMLTIRGEKKSERKEKGEQRRYAERSYGSFSRSFRLPADADAERLDASFKDGVLTIAIPKSEEAKPRTIAIRSE